VLILLSAYNGYTQDYRINERTSFYVEEISSDSLLLKVDNEFAIPISVKLDLNLTNLYSTSGDVLFAIVKPGAVGQLVARFTKINPDEDYQCLYSWRTVLGDVSKIPDPLFLYSYPFQKHNAYHISQGPGDDFSHQQSFAYDFVMPEGSQVTAAREGVVAFVDVRYDAGGPDRDLMSKANVISVLHADGTIANYVHLNKNGSLVKEGEVVKKGQVIGLSGNTGYTTGAHLHFEVIQPSLDSDHKKWVIFNWDRPTYSNLQGPDANTVSVGSGVK
jgi:murein DD-endopeptidase MepM/ murein hydrolase activator NlpD